MAELKALRLDVTLGFVCLTVGCFAALCVMGGFAAVVVVAALAAIACHLREGEEEKAATTTQKNEFMSESAPAPEFFFTPSDDFTHA